MSDDLTPTPIDPEEFASGRQVEFHHIHGCEVCAKLQRLLMRYQDMIVHAKALQSELERLRADVVKASDQQLETAIEQDKAEAVTEWLLKKLISAERARG